MENKMPDKNIPETYIVDGATGSVLWFENDDLVAAPMWSDPDKHDGDIAEWDNPVNVSWGMIDPEVEERDRIILKLLRELHSQQVMLPSYGG